MTDIKRYAHINFDTGEVLGFYKHGRKDLPADVIEVTLEQINKFNEEQYTHVDYTPENYDLDEEGNTSYLPSSLSFYKVEAEKTEQELYEEFKANRAFQVSNITVEVDGLIFDGDEQSQDRMSRALNALEPQETTLWILNNNSTATVTREQLKLALRLSGEVQTSLWIQP